VQTPEPDRDGPLQLRLPEETCRDPEFQAAKQFRPGGDPDRSWTGQHRESHNEQIHRARRNVAATAVTPAGRSTHYFFSSGFFCAEGGTRPFKSEYMARPPLVISPAAGESQRCPGTRSACREILDGIAELRVFSFGQSSSAEIK